VLWNFSGSSITAGGVSIGGSVLAPNATFTGAGGSIAGDLIVGNFQGAMSFGGAAYAGDLLKPPPLFDGTTLPAVPEPETWALMILGVAAVGAALRRRRPAPLAPE
jgi:hypothetical protein